MAAAAGSGWGRDLLAAYNRPAARVGEGQSLAQSGATAMMDISDGLAKDLSRLCSESEVGAAITLYALPVAPGVHELSKVLQDFDPLALALSGGEDYELLATLPQEAVERVTAKLRERFGTPLTEIGEIRKGTGLIAIDWDGSERPLDPLGWDHFAS